MNLNDFKVFQAVAENGSFTKAAAATNTVQSNVSARIKFLEEEFDNKLFVRTTRKIELTEAGEKLLKVAKEVQVIIEDAKESISGKKHSPHGLIKIGCIHSTAALRAPGILEDFTCNYPEMGFQLKTGTSASLKKDVLSFKLDGAFIAGKVKNPELVAEPVIIEELCIVASSLTPTLEKLTQSARPLKLIVFSKGCSYRALLEKFLSSMGFGHYKYIEMDTLDGIINTIEAGLGISLMPAELIKKHYSYRNLVTFSLPGRFAKSQTVFIRRKDFPVSEGYHLFLESIVNGYSSLQ